MDGMEVTEEEAAKRIPAKISLLHLWPGQRAKGKGVLLLLGCSGPAWQVCSAWGPCRMSLQSETRPSTAQTRSYF